MLIVSLKCHIKSIVRASFSIWLCVFAWCALSFNSDVYATTDNLLFESARSGEGDAQEQSGDSLLIKSEKKLVQFTRVLSHASRLKKKEPQLARKYAQEVFDSAKKENNEEYQSRALVVLGQISKVEKDYKEAQQFFQYAFTLAAQLDNAELAIDALLNTSEVQRLMKRYEEARNSVDNAQKLALDQSNQLFLIRCYTTQGNISRSENNYDLALASYNNALSLSESYGDNKYLVSAHRNMAKTYAAQSNFQTAIFHDEQALKIIESYSKKNSKDVAVQLELIANHQRRLGDFLPALKNARQALVIQRKNKNTESIEKLVLALAIIHRKLGSYDYALKYGTELLSIAHEGGDQNQILSANNELALIYTQLEQYQNAEDFYKKTLSQFDQILDENDYKLDLRFKAAALRGLASVYNRLSKPQEALAFANQSLSIYESLNRISGSEAANRLIGQIYFRQGIFDKAATAFESSLIQARSIGARWSEASNLIHLGAVFFKKNEYKKAKESILDGLSLAEDISAKSIVSKAYQALMNIELEGENYKSAFDYLLKQHELVLERSNDEVSQRIAELEIVREMDMQERRIDILERQSRIDSLELSRKNSELNALAQKNTIKALELEKEKTMTTFTVSILVLSFVLFSLLFSLLISSRKAKKYD